MRNFPQIAQISIVLVGICASRNCTFKFCAFSVVLIKQNSIFITINAADRLPKSAILSYIHSVIVYMYSVKLLLTSILFKTKLWEIEAQLKVCFSVSKVIVYFVICRLDNFVRYTVHSKLVTYEYAVCFFTGR